MKIERVLLKGHIQVRAMRFSVLCIPADNRVDIRI